MSCIEWIFFPGKVEISHAISCIVFVFLEWCKACKCNCKWVSIVTKRVLCSSIKNEFDAQNVHKHKAHAYMAAEIQFTFTFLKITEAEASEKRPLSPSVLPPFIPYTHTANYPFILFSFDDNTALSAYIYTSVMWASGCTLYNVHIRVQRIHFVEYIGKLIVINGTHRGTKFCARCCSCWWWRR